MRILEEQEEFRFGKHEGLAVYLNGTELPDRVYQECDSNHVYEEFKRLLGSMGKVHSTWEGPRETAFYLYGKSFQEMHSRIDRFLRSYPLCQKARVTQIA